MGTGGSFPSVDGNGMVMNTGRGGFFFYKKKKHRRLVVLGVGGMGSGASETRDMNGLHERGSDYSRVARPNRRSFSFRFIVTGSVHPESVGQLCQCRLSSPLGRVAVVDHTPDQYLVRLCTPMHYVPRYVCAYGTYLCTYLVPPSLVDVTQELNGYYVTCYEGKSLG